MEFKQCKVGMVIESNVGNCYVILAVDSNKCSIDLKCVHSISSLGNVGTLYPNWRNLEGFKIVSYPC